MNQPPNRKLLDRQFDRAHANAASRTGRAFSLGRKETPDGHAFSCLLVQDELLAFEHSRADVEESLAAARVEFTTREPAMLPGLFVIQVLSGSAEQALDKVAATAPLVRSRVAHHLVADAQAHTGMCPATAPRPVKPRTTVTWLKEPVAAKASTAPYDFPLVAVIDGGFDATIGATHTWMHGIAGEPESPPAKGNYSGPYDCHGTFVAGVVRAVCPQARVWVSDVINGGVVQEVEIVSDIVAALMRGAKVISIGAALYPEGADHTPFAFDWLQRFLSSNPQFSDVVFVSPAGNDGTAQKAFPAAYEWVVGVGSVDPLGTKKSDFSNFGNDNVNVWAPGEEHVNAFVTGDYNVLRARGWRRYKTKRFTGLANWSGTSFSTPLVAGMIARLMISESLDAPGARRRLLELARPGVVAGSAAPVITPAQVA